MSSLIVLCPHCLTWIEPHAQCCPECGAQVDVDDNDAASESLAQRLGDLLVDLGSVKLVRRGWPDCGRLLATCEGLLFVPLLTLQPNGALEATTVETPGNTSRVASLFHWWTLPPWRRPADNASDCPEITSLASGGMLELLLDYPGSFFIQRASIQRISVRWSRVQIERRPSRSVILTQVAGSPGPREALRSLNEFPPWRTLVADL